MTVTEIICDRCGARKEKSNGWWKVEVNGVSWRDGSITISKYNGKSQPGQDCCSDNCVMILLSQFMTEKEEVDHYREVGMSNG